MTSKPQSFTLIEQLLVLLITASIIFLGVVQFQSVKATFVENHFIQAFEARYLYTQKMALLTGEDTSIYVLKKDKQILFYTQSRKSYLDIPVSINTEKYPSILVFKGYSGRGGSLTSYIFKLSASKMKITYTLQMGNMRYVKKEEKI